MRLTSDDIARFLSRIPEPNENGCQEWLGRRDKDGYGAFDIRRGKRDGKEVKYTLRANIVAWEIEYGEEFPEGRIACHTCDNPPCCNARDHIYPGTHSDNMVDREVRGRANRKDGRKIRRDKGKAKGSSIDRQLGEILGKDK